MLFSTGYEFASEFAELVEVVLYWLINWRHSGLTALLLLWIVSRRHVSCFKVSLASSNCELIPPRCESHSSSSSPLSGSFLSSLDSIKSQITKILVTIVRTLMKTAMGVSPRKRTWLFVVMSSFLISEFGGDEPSISFVCKSKTNACD